MVRLLSLHDLPMDGNAAIGTSGIMLMLLMIVATLSIFSMIVFGCGDCDGETSSGAGAMASSAGSAAISGGGGGGC